MFNSPMKVRRRLACAAASVFLAMSGTAVASAAVIDIDGGVWDYGTGSSTVWSHHFHNGKRHDLRATPTARVLDLVCTGRSNSKISEVLGMSVPSVKKQVSYLLTYFGVSSRSELIALMHRS